MGTGDAPGQATGLTTVEASLLAGVSEKTIRNWVKAGRIPLERTAQGRRLPREAFIEHLRGRARAAVEQVPPEARPEGRTGPVPDLVLEEVPERVQEPLEARYRVTPAEIEQAVSRTSAQYLGDLRTVLAEVSKVYEGQLAAKDQTIDTQAGALALQQETIVELRRRAAAAEEERDALRLRLAESTVPHIAPTGGPGATEAPRATDTTPDAHRPLQGLWRRLRRRLAGG